MLTNEQVVDLAINWFRVLFELDTNAEVEHTSAIWNETYKCWCIVVWRPGQRAAKLDVWPDGLVTLWNYPDDLTVFIH